ncbi:MAG: CDP-2,3-bis-(O-geranylgeranyl)-sn-glycerol synthase [Candidatus Woesearchaeota archaeon]
MINITNLILSSVYFMLPAYFANMAPVIVRRFTNLLDYPIDFNIKFGGKPLLGKNKTWRGLFFGVVFALIIAYVQFLLKNSLFFSSISIIGYNSWLMIGFLLGLGALVGDFSKSFVKRRLSIKPGKRFFPFDQLDFIIGALIFISIIMVPPIDLLITILIISLVLHVVVNHLAYYLKIRKEKW